MRILILGAGGVGGYFGARIHETGGDVTFLVREARARQLRKSGLHVTSPHGNTHVIPKVVTRDELAADARGSSYDLIVLSSKAYDLPSAIEAIEPAVGEESAVLPLLNGVSHIGTLVERFGPHRVLGGVAFISVMLTASGEVRHLNKLHRLVAGALHLPPWDGLEPMARLFSSAGFDFVLSSDIEQAMWDKMVFLATLAGATCTMRASIGDILSTLAGESFITTLLAECAAVASACGHAVSDVQLLAYRNQLTDKGLGLTASMLRDVERSGPTEADHILGDLVARATEKGLAVPTLSVAYSHLQAYAARMRGAAG